MAKLTEQERKQIMDEVFKLENDIWTHFVSEDISEEETIAYPASKSGNIAYAVRDWLMATVEYVMTKYNISAKTMKNYFKKVSSTQLREYIAISQFCTYGVIIDRLERSAKIRQNWHKAVKELNILQLTSRVDGLFKDDLRQLAKIHKRYPKYREKIEWLLFGQGYRQEEKDFISGCYTEYL